MNVLNWGWIHGLLPAYNENLINSSPVLVIVIDVFIFASENENERVDLLWTMNKEWLLSAIDKDEVEMRRNLFIGLFWNFSLPLQPWRPIRMEGATKEHDAQYMAISDHTSLSAPIPLSPSPGVPCCVEHTVLKVRIPNPSGRLDRPTEECKESLVGASIKLTSGIAPPNRIGGTGHLSWGRWRKRYEGCSKTNDKNVLRKIIFIQSSKCTYCFSK